MANRQDKSNILNGIVASAADLMEAKVEFNELVAMQMDGVSPEKQQTADRLRKENAEIMKAVELMRRNAGCWT